MYISSSRNASFSVDRANGPSPAIVPQMAKPESTSATVAVSRWPQRMAAHINGSTAKKPKGSRLGVCSMSGLKASTPTAIARASTIPSSSNSRRESEPQARLWPTGR